MNDNISDKLIIEEFIQLWDLSRQREEAMNQLLNIVSTGTTTLLAAIAAFVFQLKPELFSVMHCYLFLSPMPFLIFGLSMLAALRHDIYRMGYYITVFFEEKYGGAAWGIRSFRFREIMKGETQDSVSLLFWSLFCISSFLFIFSIWLIKASLLHSIAILPFAVGLAYQHRSFTLDRRPIKDVWISVKAEQAID